MERDGKLQLVTFKSGIHPADKKELSKDAAIEAMPLPERVYIPLSQHTGAPARPVVKAGDKVKAGQLIAEAGGFISATVHASISGTVKGLNPYRHPFGRPQPAVEIESDEADEWDNSLIPITNLEQADPKTLIDRIAACGIVGLGGAAFPTHVKLSPPEGKKIDSLIINAAECEPYITADYRLMLEEPEKVIQGTRVFMRVLGLGKAVIAIENNKPDAIARMQSVAGHNGILIQPCQVKYPQGAEKQLISAVLKRAVPAGGLPMDIGALVQNAGTAAAVYDAVFKGRPLVERIVTVTGEGITNRKNLRVRIGTPIIRLIDYCGGFAGDPGEVILGGPMMGQALRRLSAPVIKGINAVLVLPKNMLVLKEAGPCIRCGNCVRACPMFLLPNHLGLLVRRNRIEDAEQFRVMDCMECGCCAYMCPSSIPLVQLFRFAKSEILAKRRKAAAQK